MPQAQNSLTPMDAVVEERLITFDYGINLSSGVVLTDVLSLTCVVVTGNDTNPSSRILSVAAIVNAAAPPFGSGVTLGAVSVMIGTMVAGVTYLLQCVAKTSDLQELSLWQDIECIEPT